MQDFELVYDILSNIFKEGAYASIELSKNLSKAVNKNFVTNLVYGELERDIEFDYYISRLCMKKPKKPIAIILKIGMYCLKYLNSIPAYAAVSNTVDLCSYANKRELKGFVNATLKRFASGEIDYPINEIERLSVEFSTPRFIVEEYIKAYGIEKTKAMLLKSKFPYEHFRINKTYSIEKLKQDLKKNKIKYIDSMDNAIFAKNDKFMHDLYSEGFVTIQSKTSMLVCEKMELNDGDKVLDLCAAPGGKSVYMSEIKDVKITSCDIHSHRLDLITSYVNRMKSEGITTCLNDATKVNNDFIDLFDKVLCDVPCSGLGVAKKKPDIYLNLTKEIVSGLPKIQYLILNNAKYYVKQGGILMYSTCTTLPQENEQVVDRFIKENKGFELIEMTQYLPIEDGIDGFFIAKLRRI